MFVFPFSCSRTPYLRRMHFEAIYIWHVFDVWIFREYQLWKKLRYDHTFSSQFGAAVEIFQNIGSVREYMWQSHVEIEGYSVVYFNCIAAFEVPYRWTSVKGGPHMCFVDSLDIHASMKHIWALPLTEVQWYGALKAAMQLKYTTE